MPGLIRSQPASISFLGQMKVSISRSHAPKQMHSTITSRAIPVSLEPQFLSRNIVHPSYLITTASQEATRPPALTINDLPPEILAEIFHTYLFWEDESDLIDPDLEGLIPVIEPSSRAAPLLFCQVCSYWRGVAISTPSLWSSIALKETLQVDTLKIWLKRSRNYPLSFYIRLTRSRSSPDRWTRLPELMELLYANIHRWRDVFVNLPTPEDMRSFTSILFPVKGESPASMLRTLDFSKGCRGHHLDHETVARLSSFPHKSFQRFTWGDVSIPKFDQMDRSSWQNLQQLALLKTSSGIVFAFLKGCPNIRFVNVNVWRTECVIDMPTLPTLALNLEVLDIGQVSGDVAQALVLLIAPKLQRLSYSQYDDPTQTALLESFLLQSRCKLSCLSVLYGSYSFGKDEVRRMFTSKLIREIPNVSARLPKELFLPTFIRSLLDSNASDTSARPPAYMNSYSHVYHFGWGNHDFLREYDGYPFLIKGLLPTAKWQVANRDGPTTS